MEQQSTELSDPLSNSRGSRAPVGPSQKAPSWVKGQSGNPRGRAPKELPPNSLELIESLAMHGCRELDIARACGMCLKTWQRRKRSDPAIQEAFDKGRGRLHDGLVGTLIKKGLRGEVVPLLFALKALFNYSDQPTPEVSTTNVVIHMPGATPLASYKPPKAIEGEVERDE